MSVAAEALGNERPGLERERLIEANLPLVESLARGFAHRGERMDDLVQVGAIGLINAVDRFDEDRGVDLRAYAIPTIVGEMRRHLRDRSTTIRVPRREQAARSALRRARRELAARLDHQPTWSELVESTELPEAELARGVVAERATAPLPLTALAASPETAVDDSGYQTGEDRALVGEGLAALDAQERRALGLSFFGGLSQREVAVRLGISQSHASRLIGRALAKMRSVLGDDEVCLTQHERLDS
jgi:RNA polymerase sigma-B factor